MILRLIGNVVIWTTFVVLFIALAPGLPPYDVEFESFTQPARFTFDGPLTPNDWLDNVEFLSDKIDKPSIGYLKVISPSLSPINRCSLVMTHSFYSMTKSLRLCTLSNCQKGDCVLSCYDVIVKSILFRVLLSRF